MGSLFSIIIPTYNSCNTIAQALQSIIDQTYTDFEVLIIDGLSSDNTKEKVFETVKDDKRFKFYSEKDNGVYDAMNKGIKCATGQWLLFLGSDDKLYDKNVLRNAQDILVKTDANLVYGNVQLNGKASWADDGCIYDGEFSVSKLFLKNICHQAIFYSKQIIEKVGYYNTAYRICADWDYNLRCFAVGKAQYFNRIVSLFKGGGESTTVQENDFTTKERAFRIKQYFGYSYFNYRFEGFNSFFYDEAYAFLKQKKYFKALKYFARYFYHSSGKRGILKQYFLMLLNKKRLP
jgi:glycosyltransferase involved in cell wall biosynthesis